MVQARITKFSPLAAGKTLVSGTVKLFHKFEGGSPRTRVLNERGWAKFAIFGCDTSLYHSQGGTTELSLCDPDREFGICISS